MPSVAIVEVGPRDGLQSEDTVLSTTSKLELIDRCVKAGVRRIEAASFVHPKLVPQMADAEAVMAALPDDEAVSYIGLVLNRRGLERALATRVDEVNFVVAASEGYNRSNSNASVAETLGEIEAMLPEAERAGKRTSVTISVAFGDPYDGEVAPTAVTEIAARVAEAGADEVAVADTIGAAVPGDVTVLLQAVRAAAPSAGLRCHFHNTRNTGYANAVAAIEAGVDALDASVAGFGGSPFAPNAGGNIGTEDLVHMLDRMGVDHGLSLAPLLEAAVWLEGELGHPGPAMLTRAGPFPR